MTKDLEQDLAYSLETRKELLPYLPELLVDLWALGSSPDVVVEMLRPCALPKSATRVLDLGCGKGAVAVTLAKEMEFTALGIDANRAFLEAAVRKAEEWQVADRCRFEYGDIRESVKELKDFDVVVYASLGGLLGGFTEIVAKLRRTVRRGGYILVDDGYSVAKDRIERAGYEHYLPHDQTLSALTAHGDRLVEERILSQEHTHRINYGYLDAIKKRSRELVLKNPRLQALITEYIRNQEVECEFLDRYVISAIWLLQKP